MQNQKPFAIKSFMDIVPMHLNIAKMKTDILPHHLIMITRYVDHLSIVFGFAQDRPEDICMFLRPISNLFQRPEVDYITD